MEEDDNEEEEKITCLFEEVKSEWSVYTDASNGLLVVSDSVKRMSWDYKVNNNKIIFILCAFSFRLLWLMSGFIMVTN